MRPYVKQILVVIQPMLIDADYYARVEGYVSFVCYVIVCYVIVCVCMGVNVCVCMCVFLSCLGCFVACYRVHTRVYV